MGKNELFLSCFVIKFNFSFKIIPTHVPVVTVRTYISVISNNQLRSIYISFTSNYDNNKKSKPWSY